MWGAPNYAQRCIADRVKGRKRIEGTQFDDGDFAIAVQW